jgi:hypothetical protein
MKIEVNAELFQLFTAQIRLQHMPFESTGKKTKLK